MTRTVPAGDATTAVTGSLILCIDGEPMVRAMLERTLGAMGHRAVPVASLDECLKAANREPFDLVIADLEHPGDRGRDLLRTLRQQGLEAPVIVTSPYTSVERAVAAIRYGATDYLTKPLRVEAVRLAVGNAIELDRMRRVNDDIQREIHALRGPSEIVGASAVLRQVRELVASVAPTRATVLLEGESGTGKELFAREIHRTSPRAGERFVTVNCAALPEGLVESTLFGHERGAFTGATQRMAGAFERAHRGSLLLDEISEMKLELQSKLLRAIQEQEFERVGGDQPVRVDVRIIATTNRDLLAEVEAGRFRRDLYYRLHVVPIRTPPLREHLEDLPALVEHFASQAAARLGIRPPEIAPATVDVLGRHDWPGNIRELANAVERAVILARGARLEPGLFALERRGPASPAGETTPRVGAELRRSLEEVSLNLRVIERHAIQRALEKTGGHRARAARLLGISERTLRNKLKG